MPKKQAVSNAELMDYLRRGAFDGWQNILTGLGMRNRDKRRSNEIRNVDQITEPEAEEIYQADAIARRMIEKPSEEALRRGLVMKVDKATQSNINTWMDRLEVIPRFMQGGNFGHMYGGAGAFLSLDDGLPLDEPVDLGRIRDINSIVILNRWELWTQPTDVVRDINNPMYGYPEYYYLQPRAIPAVTSSAPGAVRQMGSYDPGSSPSTQSTIIRGTPKPMRRKQMPSKATIKGSGSASEYDTGTTVGEGAGANVMNVKIHSSRIIRFDGAPLPIRKRMLNNYWDDSIFTAIREALADFGISCSNVANIIHDYSVAVYTMKDLAALVKGKDNAEIIKIFQTMSLARNMLGAFIVQEGEKFEWASRSTQGLADLLDRVKLRLQAVCPMPHTILFNESPGGSLGNGEDSENRKWYDWLDGQRKTYWEPRFNRLFEIMFACQRGPTNGTTPAEWGYEWPALWAPSDQQLAETRKTVAETDQIYVDMGALDAQEIRESRFGGDEYSMEIHLIDGMDPVAEKKEQRQADIDAQMTEEMPNEKQIIDCQGVMASFDGRIALQSAMLLKRLYPTVDYARTWVEKLTGRTPTDSGALSTRQHWIFTFEPLLAFDQAQGGSKFRRFSPAPGLELVYGEHKAPEPEIVNS